MNIEFDTTRALCIKILENAHAYTWTTQGLGMLRMYLTPDKSLRLHIWHGALCDPRASRLHNHPWDFDSLIVSGKIGNVRYVRTTIGDPWMQNTITCGPGGCEVSVPKQVRLKQSYLETYTTGGKYSQLADEIHDTQPSNGTVTIIRRTFHEDTERANVFFKPGEKWYSAEPRCATPDEIEMVVAAALYLIRREGA